MRKANLLLKLAMILAIVPWISTSASAKDNVVINEICYNPPGSDADREWVELFNRSYVDTYNLKKTGWKFNDGSNHGFMGLEWGDSLLGPRGFAILVKKWEGFLDLYPGWDNAHPDIGVFHVAMSLSNDGDMVFLIDSNNDTAEAPYTYPDSADDGVWYRCNPDTSPPSSSPWRADTCYPPGTPGEPNGGNKPPYISNVSHNPFHPDCSHTVIVSAQISDDDSVAGDSIFYKVNLGSFTSFSHDSVNGTVYYYHINPQSTDDTVYYYIWAMDNDDLIAVSDTSHYIVGEVIHRNVVINEIMHNPSTEQGSDTYFEWIELWNIGDTTIDINGWKFTDGEGTYTIPSISMTPNFFLVIAKNPDSIYAHADSGWEYYDNLRDGNDTVIGPWGSGISLSDNDQVVILDSDSIMIDSVDYESSSPWPTEPRNQGPSLERVDPNGEPNDPLNWKASNEKYGTPGDTNSIIPSYDIGFLNSSDISFEENGRDIYVKAQVHNFGTERADSAEVLFFSINPDTCVDTIGEVKRIGPIDSGSVVTALSDLWVAQPNSYIVCAYTTLLDTTDFDTTNNKISKSLMVGYTAPEIVINEIMYKPETGKAEWIELFNRTKDSIDVKGWELGDTTETTSIIDTGYIIPPGGFLIVTEDDSLFRLKYPEVDSNIVIEQKRWKTLSNDDEIILKSSRGFITEDVKYKNDWMWQYEGIKGISLERVNPDLDPNDKANWWACTDTKMATPGEPNSVFQPIPPSAELKAEPNPFCPDEERTLISYEVSPRSLVTIRVYDVRGREVRVVMDQEQKGGKGTIIWDGRDDDGTILPIGIYVIYLEACDTYGGNITILKNTVVVAKHLK